MGLRHPAIYEVLAHPKITKPRQGPSKPLSRFARKRLKRKAVRTVATRGMGMLATRSTSTAVTAMARTGVRMMPIVGYAFLAYDLFILMYEIQKGG